MKGLTKEVLSVEPPIPLIPYYHHKNPMWGLAPELLYHEGAFPVRTMWFPLVENKEKNLEDLIPIDHPIDIWDGLDPNEIQNFLAPLLPTDEENVSPRTE